MINFIKILIQNKNKAYMGIFLLLGVLGVIKNFFKTKDIIKKQRKSKNKGEVDKIFLQNLLKLLKIAIPNFYSPILLDMFLLTAALVSRTYLSIYLATVKGLIVKEIVNKDFKMFLFALGKLGLCAIPGSILNSTLVFFNRKISLGIRKNITKDIMKDYLKNKIFY